METSTIALIIIGILVILYISEVIPIAVTSILACIAMAVFGVIPLNEAFAGFGNDIVFFMAGMITVGNALYETGAAQLVGKKIISMVGTNEKVFIGVLIVLSIPISAFLSNTATAAIMLPLSASVIAASSGKLNKKNTYMLVGMAAVSGGALTLVSSPPQMIAQGLLEAGNHQTMGFFDVAIVGIPLFVLLFIYSQTFGMKLQKKFFKFEEKQDVVLVVEDDTPKSVPKMLIAFGALILCIVGFITEFLSFGIVAMIGALVCIITKCISLKKTYEKMDWTTIIIFGCSFGIAAGLGDSGAGAIIANGTISLLGEAVSPFLLAAVLAVVAMILTNFMSSTATANLLVPIAIFAAIELGYDVRGIAMATALASGIGYATPMSTPPMTMTLTGGYRFKDYIIVGGVFNILALGLLILLLPLIV